mmetsp:Transcript_17420/g.36745  ORF Transcript_17420/g.36745 Transcript_17420/m.36745 type:complete len:581 (-) Transcript_17420:147-1889(-)|eukprot:CAMPEP_0183748376 /NCGR_PEP_ID=MMETSP0737-20130205/67734_1 /TAXON_ID=385413 /ORGANISM="Thalassiosira miniscula, Strain CCMP1093" /LENGTH=580 /DNA_ID=CAMNT_0025984099 /DNA_START=2084 /DNA_END=3826 /DNA_ORIENTATION=+
MSLMTESLLLEAQSLRSEGEHDDSIDLLRTVLSQCNSDLRRLAQRGVLHGTIDDACKSDGSEMNAEQATTLITTRQLRQTAAYQLALQLLQRAGVQQHRNNINIAHPIKCHESLSVREDEREADRLLWKLGYRLRLSSLALGYPSCDCIGYKEKTKLNNVDTQKALQMPVIVIDNALPSIFFYALQHGFREKSRYWSEFYCKVNSGESQSNSDIPQQTKANQFASHNIPLPLDKTHPSQSVAQNVQDAKSLFEQVAIIVQDRLRKQFADIVNATSVEVWSHRRPPDGQHQLHYDMDEILLWKRRRETCQQHAGGRASKRHKTSHESATNTIICKDGEEGRVPMRRSKEERVSCPIVSCVLTIYVPKCTSCHVCGAHGNSSAPTIICNQSITNPKRSCKSNIGRLCYPSPNRLVAFDGSLLHGVVPGIPVPSFKSSCSSDDSASSDGGFDDQRFTLMMGFWKDVCLTDNNEDRVKGEISAEAIGPNVPFASLQQRIPWTNEFNPVPVSDADFSSGAGEGDCSRNEGGGTTIEPLWLPVKTNDDVPFGKYADYDGLTQFHGRYFLTTNDTEDIDSQVMSITG